MSQDEFRQLPAGLLHRFDGRLQRAEFKHLEIFHFEPAQDSRELMGRGKDRSLQPQRGKGVVRVPLAAMEGSGEAELLDAVDSIKAQDLLAHGLAPEPSLIVGIQDGVDLKRRAADESADALN